VTPALAELVPDLYRAGPRRKRGRGQPASPQLRERALLDLADPFAAHPEARTDRAQALGRPAEAEPGVDDLAFAFAQVPEQRSKLPARDAVEKLFVRVRGHGIREQVAKGADLSVEPATGWARLRAA
jgi:hypothetical protein